ncbi:Hypothetical Protein FCC1311_076972 [Hondaea fermentalgiana]|uniref:Uncharacterized protein n=1 Tax=Hondaea fermentalgiana TaxID=2315210 RepID=A0A2R5GS49_9STRA|nr:Hypothetical Protein FCC1311_076972 [Hondaea fermentalgiana]|eukprot:GBG31473.1 Hypothetical Protein FCC1311_076972 [Hondaea fermentalgiana]
MIARNSPFVQEVLNTMDSRAHYLRQNRRYFPAPAVILAVVGAYGDEDTGCAVFPNMDEASLLRLQDGSRTVDRVDLWTCELDLDEISAHPPLTKWKWLSRSTKILSPQAILSFYQDALRPDDVVILVSNGLAFLDARRLFDFAERVRGNPALTPKGAAAQSSAGESPHMWLANSMGNPWQLAEGLVSAELSADEAHAQLAKNPQRFTARRGEIADVLFPNEVDPNGEAIFFAFSGRTISHILRQQQLSRSQTWPEVVSTLIRGGVHFKRDLGLVASAFVARTSGMAMPTQVHLPVLDGPSLVLAPRKDLSPKQIWTNFAGREPVYSLQMRYVKQLLDRGVVDEAHIWDITCKTKSSVKDTDAWYTDRKWMHEIAYGDPRVKIVTPYACRWYTYYEFYASEDVVIVADDVILKVDDDVLFFDVEAVPGFVQAVRASPDTFLWSAAVFNNDVTGGFLVRDGVLPRELGPPQWRFPDKIIRMHKYICDNLDKVLYKTRALGEKRVSYAYKGRCSINFVAIRGSNVALAHEYVSDHSDDEHFLTEHAQAMGSREEVYMGLMAAHATFFTQVEATPDIVKIYHAALAEKKIP